MAVKMGLSRLNRDVWSLYLPGLITMVFYCVFEERLNATKRGQENAQDERYLKGLQLKKTYSRKQMHVPKLAQTTTLLIVFTGYL